MGNGMPPWMQEELRKRQKQYPQQPQQPQQPPQQPQQPPQQPQQRPQRPGGTFGGANQGGGAAPPRGPATPTQGAPGQNVPIRPPGMPQQPKKGTLPSQKKKWVLRILVSLLVITTLSAAVSLIYYMQM